MRDNLKKVGHVLVWVLIIAMPVLSLLFAFGYNITIVDGISMYPTLFDNDIVITEKNFTAERDDLIVFSADGHYLIKRVVGLPGETVQIIDGYVYINDVPYNDVVSVQMEEAGIFAEPTVIPEGHYFVLGDNRNHSSDSRAFGAISASDIKGRVICHWGKGKIS